MTGRRSATGARAALVSPFALLLVACGTLPAAPDPSASGSSRPPSPASSSSTPPETAPPPSAPSTALSSDGSAVDARTDIRADVQADVQADARAGPSTDAVPGPTAPPPVSGPASRRARVRDAALLETSGLAVSRRDGGVLWAINDGGHAPALHALTFDGRPLGRWPIDVANRDWEDLVAFRLDGEPYLLIADTGDNGRRRDEVALHLVAEPVPRGPGAAPGTRLAPRRTLRFRYEDGPRDVEAVAVDEPSGTVWLLPKAPVAGGRGVAGGAYTLPLPGADGTASAGEALAVARRAATLAAVARGLVERLAASVAGVDLEQPTAFDIAADGRTGCLLTYRRVRCFERADGEDWSETLARPGTALAAHGLDQAEALALSPDGALIAFTSEGRAPPLRVRRRPDGTR